MVKTITPRGVGRPDNEKEVYRMAIATPLIGQKPYSDAVDFTLTTFDHILVLITPEIPEGYRLILRKVIVSIHQNLLLVATIKTWDGKPLATKFGYKIVEFNLYPGIPVEKGKGYVIDVYKYSTDAIDGSVTALGVLEYVGE